MSGVSDATAARARDAFLAAEVAYQGGGELVAWRAAVEAALQEPADPAVIRPRTKDERTALLTGFAMALEMVEKDGGDAAREWLRTMLESEERIGV